MNNLWFFSESDMAPNAEEELLVVKPWGPQPEKVVSYIETKLSKLLCNKYTDAIVHVLACRRVNGAEALWYNLSRVNGRSMHTATTTGCFRLAYLSTLSKYTQKTGSTGKMTDPYFALHRKNSIISTWFAHVTRKRILILRE